MLNQGLCFRCEERAKFLEEGISPRCECGMVTSSKYSCYMYKPVRPVVIKKNEDDDRPQFAGAMLSARSHFVRMADCELKVAVVEDGKVLYWEVKE